MSRDSTDTSIKYVQFSNSGNASACNECERFFFLSFSLSRFLCLPLGMNKKWQILLAFVNYSFTCKVLIVPYALFFFSVFSNPFGFLAALFIMLFSFCRFSSIFFFLIQFRRERKQKSIYRLRFEWM